MERPHKYVDHPVSLCLTDEQEFGPTLKRHHLTALPPYLILHIKRFTKNNFVEERNPTVVNFPLRGVELSDCESNPWDLYHALTCRCRPQTIWPDSFSLRPSLERHPRINHGINYVNRDRSRSKQEKPLGRESSSMEDSRESWSRRWRWWEMVWDARSARGGG